MNFEVEELELDGIKLNESTPTTIDCRLLK
jgi:hypothetical protein